MIHPGFHPDSLGAGITRTSSVDKKKIESHRDQLAQVAEVALAHGMLTEAEAEELSSVGSSAFFPDSAIGHIFRDGHSIGVRFHIGRFSVLMFRGSAAERDEEDVARFQHHLSALLRESRAPALLAATPKRAARSATDSKNVLLQTIREMGVKDVICADGQRFDIRTETGMTDLARAILDAAVERDALVRMMTDRRAMQEGRGRWSRGQPPPAPWRLVGDRAVELDEDVLDVILNHVVPALAMGHPLSQVKSLLRELRVVGPHVSGTQCWRVLEPHEPYPPTHHPEIRQFCRGVDAWLSGTYSVNESCPLESETYLDRPVWTDQAGRKFVTTQFDLGALDLSPAQVEQVEAVRDRLAQRTALPARTRSNPYAGAHFEANGRDWAIRLFQVRNHEIRYEIVDRDTGTRGCVLGAGFLRDLVEVVAHGLEFGTPAKAIAVADTPTAWNGWLNSRPREIAFLRQRVTQLEETLDTLTAAVAKATTDKLRRSYESQAEQCAAELEEHERALCELEAAEEPEWSVETDLVPRALAALASSSPPRDARFANLIHLMLPLTITAAEPGMARVSATLHAPTKDGLVRLGPFEFTTPDLGATHLLDPNARAERDLWDAGRWLLADDHARIQEFGGPLSESGRAARQRMGKALSAQMPRTAADCILSHPVAEARSIVWEILSPTDLASNRTVVSPLRERLEATYVLGTFGSLTRPRFFVKRATASIVDMLAARADGRAPLEWVRAQLTEFHELTTKGARTRVDEARRARLVEVSPVGDTERQVSLRPCPCGGKFSIFVAAPEVAENLLCDLCRCDTSGLRFPDDYVEAANAGAAAIRASDLHERQAGMRGQSTTQLLRARAALFGIEVYPKGRFPRKALAELQRLEGLLQLLGDYLAPVKSETKELDEATLATELVALLQRIDPTADITADAVRADSQRGSSAEWRARATNQKVPVPRRGPVPIEVRIRTLLAERDRTPRTA